jgi:hypothetical protein
VFNHAEQTSEVSADTDTGPAFAGLHELFLSRWLADRCGNMDPIGLRQLVDMLYKGIVIQCVFQSIDQSIHWQPNVLMVILSITSAVASKCGIRFCIHVDASQEMKTVL